MPQAAPWAACWSGWASPSPACTSEVEPELTVDLRLTVAYGLPIAEVARQVEASVRYALRHAIEREPDRVTDPDREAAS